MLIAFDYQDGRIKEFDAGAFTSVEAMRGRDRGARNSMTELDLRLDRVKQGGDLRLDFYWYDVSSATDNVTIPDEFEEDGSPVLMPRARRKRGTSIVLASAQELEKIARVIVYRANGSVQALWRQGSNWLIVGSMFEAQRVLAYSDARTTSLNAQACAVFRYLRRQNPSLTEEEAAQLMGYPLAALKDIEEAEWAQVSEEGGSGGEDRSEGREEPEVGDVQEPRDWYGEMVCEDSRFSQIYGDGE